MIGAIDTVVEDPSTLTWWEAYGAKVMTVGEDGDWIALGRIEPRRMIAAMLKAAREQLTLDRDEVFGCGYHPDADEVAAIVANVQYSRALFTIPAGADPSWEWVVHWAAPGADHEDARAVDVTLWRI